MIDFCLPIADFYIPLRILEFIKKSILNLLLQFLYIRFELIKNISRIKVKIRKRFAYPSD